MTRLGMPLSVVPIFLLLSACSDSADTAASSAFGDNWPFTVDSGELKCIVEDGDQIALFVHDGTEYAINSSAKDRGFASVEPLLKDHPSIPGMKTNVTMAVIAAALKECK